MLAGNYLPHAESSPHQTITEKSLPHEPTKHSAKRIWFGALLLNAAHWTDGDMNKRAPIVDTRLTDLRGATVLIGSGLSSDRRSGLPAGAQVGQAVMRTIMADFVGYEPKEFEAFWQYAWITPFEQIFNDYPSEQHLRSTFACTYGSAKTNPFYERLADCVRAGHISAIVTTNYDLCIEAALEKQKIPYTVVVDEKTLIPSDHLPVFKIHGSADAPASLVVNLKHEGMLPSWKAELFQQLCAHRPVYVMGYSGSDFDICPHLFGIAPSTLYWLVRPSKDGIAIDAMSGNLHFAVDHPAMVPALRIVAGDFSHALGLQTETFLPSHGEGSLVSELFNRADNNHDAFAYWSAMLLNAIACRSGAQRALAACSSTFQRSSEGLRLQAALLERQGQYAASVSTMKCARKAARKAHRHARWAEFYAIAAGTLYTGGFLVRFLTMSLRAHVAKAVAKYAGVSRDEAELLTARLLYLGLLRASVVRRLPGGEFLTRKRSAALKVAATAAATTFYRQGLWQDVHLVRSKAMDLEIEVPVGPDGETHTIPPASFGFSQLGNLVGIASQYRRETVRTAERCRFILDGLIAYGHFPETWKAWVAFKDDMTASDSDELRAAAATAFRACAYSPLAVWLLSDIRHAAKLFAAETSMDDSR